MSTAYRPEDEPPFIGILMVLGAAHILLMSLLLWMGQDLGWWTVPDLFSDDRPAVGATSAPAVSPTQQEVSPQACTWQTVGETSGRLVCDDWSSPTLDVGGVGVTSWFDPTRSGGVKTVRRTENETVVQFEQPGRECDLRQSQMGASPPVRCSIKVGPS